MKRLLTPRTALALFVMGLGAGSHSMSVGPLHGTTAVGRPLDVSAQVQFDPRDGDEKCLRADVFYGDAQVAADRVQVSVHRSDSVPGALVRVVSPKVVDEAFVTVVMRAGCQASTAMRRFVMLAEPPSEQPALLAAATAPVTAARAQPAPAMERAVRAEPAPAVQRTVRAAAPVANVPATFKAARSLPMPQASAEPTRTRAAHRLIANEVRAERRGGMSTTLASVDASNAARLRLEPGAMFAVQNGQVLRVSTEMRNPGADATQRAAAALLWQAINAQPQDLLRLNDRMRTLERELAAVRQLAITHRQELTGLRERSEQSTAPQWTWIGALLLLLAGTAGYAAWRTSIARAAVRTTDSGWFEYRDEAPLADQGRVGEQAAGRASVPSPGPVTRPPGVVSRPQSLPPEIDLELDSVAPESLPPVSELAPLEFDPESEAPQLADSTTGERVSALSGVLQECEFLVSLGYVEKAADVLRTYIERTKESSALALLELRDLYRRLGDTEGVLLAEDEFRCRFGEEPPRDDTTAGLEACEAAIAHVMSAWPQPEVLTLIEELLFSPPAMLGGYPSLYAWRDLLWLHGLAYDTLHGVAEEDVPASAEGLPEMTLESLTGIDVERASQRFAMDMNLLDVDPAKHRVIDQQHVLKLPPMPDLKFQPRPAPAPAPGGQRKYEDFLDAVGAAEGRALHVR